MLDISAGGTDAAAKVLALAVRSASSGADGGAEPELAKASLAPTLADELAEFLGELTRPGSPGSVNTLPGPAGTRRGYCWSASVPATARPGGPRGPA